LECITVMKIKVDHRERTLIKLLKALNNDYKFELDIEVEKMDIGDVSILTNEGEELLLIERKQLSDLASSLRDGRYNEQSYRLNGYPLHNHNIIYLIEGKISFYSSKYSKVAPGTLYVTTFCLQYFKGFSAVRTFDIAETAEYILRLADKLKREKSKIGFYHAKFIEKPVTYTEVIHKIKKNNITKDNIGEILLSQIPGVSKNAARVIMSRYDSLFALLTALNVDKTCLKDITFPIKNGKSRHLSNTCIRNISTYLFAESSLKIKT